MGLRTARDAAAVACFAVLLYLPTLRFDLVWDDPMLVELTRTELGAGGVPALLSSEFILGSRSEPSGYFRPVVLASLGLDSRLGHGKPWAYHLTNVLLNAAVCAVVVLLLRRLLNSREAALFGGLLFASHPAHVEAVAFVSGRTDLWAALFVVVASLVWIRERVERVGSPRWIAIAVASGLLAFGSFSKELAMMTVPAWLGWDALGVARSPGASRSWIQRNAPWMAGALAALAVVVMMRSWIAGVGFPAPRGATPSVSLVSTIASYFKLLTVPWPLSAYYTAADLTVRPAIIAGAIVTIALFVGAHALGSRQAAAAGLCWTLAFLIPVLGVVPLRGGILAERFLYLPSFGVGLAAAALWRRLHGQFRIPALAIAAAAVCGGSGLTLLRSQVWKAELSLYTDMARTSPQSFVAHFNVGNEQARVGRLDEAERSLAVAVQLAPDRADGWNNLGSVRQRLGKSQEAASAYAEAIRLRPDFALARNNAALLLVEMGKASAEAGRLLEAEALFRRAIEAAPGLAPARGDLGLLYLSEGRARDALPLLARAVALDPSDAPTRFNLGSARLAVGDLRGAEDEAAALRSIDADLARELDRRLERARKSP